jgi:hypothetical protein
MPLFPLAGLIGGMGAAFGDFGPGPFVGGYDTMYPGGSATFDERTGQYGTTQGQWGPAVPSLQMGQGGPNAIGGDAWQRGVTGNYTGGYEMTPYGPGIRQGSIGPAVPSLQMGAGNPRLGYGMQPLSAFGRGGWGSFGSAWPGGGGFRSF